VADAQRGAIVAAPLVRAGARVRGVMRVGGDQVMRVDLSASGKKFLAADAREEDVGVVAGDLRYAVAFARRRVMASVRLRGYDALGDDRFALSRTFGFVDGQAQLTLRGAGAQRLSAHVGTRALRYKPDEQYDYRGDRVDLRYATTMWRGEDGDEPFSIGLAAGYRLEHRGYAGLAFVDTCGPGDAVVPDCFVPTERGRDDWVHRVTADVVYTGDRIYRGRYELQVVDSNSAGQSQTRHRLEAEVTTETIADIYLTVEAVIQIDVFRDALLLARDINTQTFVTIDDENRNALIVHAMRTLGRRWAVEARYAVFSNELATVELSFRRQTGYLGVVYTYDAR